MIPEVQLVREVQIARHNGLALRQQDLRGGVCRAAGRDVPQDDGDVPQHIRVTICQARL